MRDHYYREVREATVTSLGLLFCHRGNQVSVSERHQAALELRRIGNFHARSIKGSTSRRN